MRSYYEHLRHTQNDQVLTEKKPTFRASAIFPALHTKDISTRYIFLSYWMLKRNISKINCLTTLRDQSGKTLHRAMEMICEAKAYSIEVEDLLNGSNKAVAESFVGSVEIEFFSVNPLIFPFPAIAINFYGPHFSSVVHSAQRVYNDYEDMITNSKQHVPEAGFNIYADKVREPFLTLINGPIAEKHFPINFLFTNKEGEVLEYEHIIENLIPYETVFLYPNREIDLADFLKNDPGTAKVNFNLQWIYPRIIVGNMNKTLPALSLTHSYYDCSQSTEATDFWLPPSEKYHPASLIVPATIEAEAFTNITFYPIYAPSSFSIDLEIYDGAGELKARLEEVVSFTKSCGEYISLNIKEICLSQGISQTSLGIRLIAKQKGHAPIPSRIKVSIDRGKIDNGIPCNICTNLIPYNKDWEMKSSTFRWLPILGDQKQACAWIMNNMPDKTPFKKTKITLTYYRLKDTETVVQKTTLPPCGFTIIDLNSNSELRKFFDGTVGWCTIRASNPYISSYYFAENESGVIGGDHGF